MTETDLGEAAAVADGPRRGRVARVLDSPALDVLRIHDYRWYWLATLLYFTVFGAQRFAFVLLVLEISDSAGLGGVTGFALGIPAFFITVPAGVWADSHDRRRLVMFTNACASVVLLTVAVVIWAGAASVWTALVLALAAGTAGATAQPALMAIVPAVVPPSRLMSAIVLRTVGQNFAMVVGNVVGGVAIALLGFGGAFAVQGALGVIAILGFARLRPMPAAHARQGAPSGMREQAREGLAYVLGDPALRALVVLLVISGVFMIGPVFVLVPEIARTQLGVGPFLNSMLFAAMSVGMLLMSAFLASVPNLRRKGYWFLLNMLLPGPYLMLMAWSDWYAFSAVMMFLWGIGGGVFMNLNMTLMQANTPDRLQGRVMSISGLSIAGLVPLGSLLAGGGAEVIGAAGYLGLSGAVLSVAAVLTFARAQALRDME
ncbi:MAG: MFS transporter [Dehalococcoidia bacterium]